MTKKKTIIYVVSRVQHAIAFEWTATALSAKYVFIMVLLNPVVGPLEGRLKTRGITVVSIRYRGKQDLPFALLKLLRLFFQLKPDIVHTHLFDASIAGLAAAWIARVPKRIYTRHTSTFHHDYSRGGVKYDRFCNLVSTHIISISQATDYALSTLESVDKSKIVRIEHGFEFADFSEPDPERVEAVRVRWGIPNTAPCLGVVARHIEWKGIQYVIPAFKSFLVKYPEAVLILANGTGPFHDAVMRMLTDVPKGNYVVIPFEEDMTSLFRLFDMYIHVPVDRHCEAFGQTYIEALANGVPSIFARSGIAEEFVEDEVHALVVAHRNADAVLKAMERLWLNKDLRDRMIISGRDYVTTHFGFSPMVDKLTALYNE